MNKEPVEAIGIDGCRYGWVIAFRKKERIDIKLVHTLEEILTFLKAAKIVCIDMPMGLASSKENDRECDGLLRKELGSPFSASVFNVPCREAVYAGTYSKANGLNKRILGKGISKQSWNICHKIKELDTLLQRYTSLGPVLKECHPELCFKQLNQNTTLSHKKKTPEGIKERSRIIHQQTNMGMNAIEALLSENKKGLNDDILDAMVLAVTAGRMLEQGNRTLPDRVTYDINHIPMQVHMLKL